MKIEVHDTAFMIAYYRAQHEALSKDPYAKLWLEKDISSWTDGFAKHVSEHDEMLHCMRNRYFHDRIQQIVIEEPETLFINLGAGFSMYPYVLSESVTTVEIELPEIKAYKEAKLKTFFSEGKIPKRNVISIAKNITDEGQHTELVAYLKSFKRKRTVILIEGVFFFLNKAEIASVLSLCKQLQEKDDVLMCVCFDSNSVNTEVFGRLKTYFSDVLDSHSNPFTALPHSYYNSIDGYLLKTTSSSLDLGKELALFPSTFDENKVLNEYFYTLIRK